MCSEGVEGRKGVRGGKRGVLIETQDTPSTQQQQSHRARERAHIAHPIVVLKEERGARGLSSLPLPLPLLPPLPTLSHSPLTTLHKTLTSSPRTYFICICCLSYSPPPTSLTLFLLAILMIIMKKENGGRYF